MVRQSMACAAMLFLVPAPVLAQDDCAFREWTSYGETTL